MEPATATCHCSDAALSPAAAQHTRFGSALVLSRVHRVRPEFVVEVKFLAWTEHNLFRQVVYEGLREDKPAARSGARCLMRSHDPNRVRLMALRTGRSARRRRQRKTAPATMRRFAPGRCKLKFPGAAELIAESDFPLKFHPPVRTAS